MQWFLMVNLANNQVIIKKHQSCAAKRLYSYNLFEDRDILVIVYIIKMKIKKLYKEKNKILFFSKTYLKHRIKRQSLFTKADENINGITLFGK
ncbi:hypothetical protein HNQ02_000083 [Flavobacterium sp. 7E]|uniref:hypothetical protein n=1 Tax=Flavobacterium sp. 7E TaxID=2735898 RepID=UPI00156F92F7|nr:hypothetical protein [Flavobacterium sp. 7E]NRS87183.1 hypothetical protein [Flavobacterium sp. 7E]